MIYSSKDICVCQPFCRNSQDEQQGTRFTSLNHRAIVFPWIWRCVSGMHVSCVAALRDYYGLEKKLVTVHEPGQMLGWLDEDLKSIIGDVRHFPRKVNFGFRNEN